MGSKAQSGRGTIIAIGATPTPIGEVKTIKRSGNQWDTEDVSNMSTSTKSKEFISTILTAGEIDLGGNRVSSDAGQIALEAGYESGLAVNFVITLPKSGTQTVAGDTYTFSALVLSLAPDSIELTKSIQFAAKLKITGDAVFAVGS